MNLSNLRKASGYTQMDYANELSISRQSYYRKEKGYVPFNDKEKIIVLNLLKSQFPDLTIDSLFFSQNTKKYKEKQTT